MDDERAKLWNLKYDEALREGENLRLSVFAYVPRPRTQGTTFFIIRMIVTMVDLLRWQWKKMKLRTAVNNSPFPLAAKMRITVTSQRILVWEMHGRRWKFPEFLGQVELNAIRRATLPFIGGGAWRTVVIYMNDDVNISIRISKEKAEGFIGALQNED